MITYTTIKSLTHLGLLFLAVYFSFRNGERSGSMYMLEFLRDNKYLRYSDYERFVNHMSKEKRKQNEG